MEKYSKFLTILLIVIIIGVIGLLAYLGYDFLKNEKKNRDGAEFTRTFTSSSENTVEETSNETPSGEINITGSGSSQGKKSSKKRTYQGYEVAGTIEIPKTSLSSPVIYEVSGKALETAPVVLYPTKAVLNSKGNVVIIGHNYRNGTFFSNNKKLSNGDKIYITDLDYNKVTYKVYKVFQASATDTSFYNRDTNGAREITLSTCTDDAKARIIVLAKAE